MKFPICYGSTALPDLDQAEIENIPNITLRTARIGSQESFFFERQFLQVLEGEKTAIDKLYAKIESDSGHYYIIRIFQREVEEPRFKITSVVLYMLTHRCRTQL